MEVDDLLLFLAYCAAWAVILSSAAGVPALYYYLRRLYRQRKRRLFHQRRRRRYHQRRPL